jgi:hypothetical protein
MDRDSDGRRFHRRLLLLVLGAALVLPLAWSVCQTDRRYSSTAFHWRGVNNWGFGWRRVAYCSEQSALFRGWRADLGLLTVEHLRSTFPVRRTVQDGAANGSQPIHSERVWKIAANATSSVWSSAFTRFFAPAA